MHLITDTVSGVWSGLPAVLAALVPALVGAVSAISLGVRDRLTIAVVAVPMSIGMLTASAQIMGWLDIGDLRLAAVLPLVVSGGYGLARALWLRKRGATGSRSSAEALTPVPAIVWACIGLAGAMSLAAWLPGFGDTSLPPQGNDDIWHGYLAARLADMPAVTAADVAPVTTDAANPVTVYPYGVHLVLAVGHAVTGATLPTVINGTWVVHVGLALPVGVAALCWRLLPGKRVAASVTALSSVLFTVFPYALNGVMPYAVTLALLPALVAAVVTRVRAPSALPAPVLALMALGLFVSHPSVALAAGAVACLVLVELLLRDKPDRIGALRSLVTPVVLTIVIAIPWILRSRSLGSAASGGATGTAASGQGYQVDEAIWTLAKLQSPWTPGQPWLAVTVLLGLVLAVLRLRAWSVAVAYLMFGGLYVGALAGVDALSSLTGPWYGDWHRLFSTSLALAPILVGTGVAAAVEGVQAIVDARRRPILTRSVVAIALALGVLGALEAARYVVRGQSTVSSAWQSPRLVTGDDLALFERLADLTNRRSKVLNNWLDGSTWMYATTGARPAIPYQPTTALIPEWNKALNPGELSVDPLACQFLLDQHVTYALGKQVGLAGSGGTLQTALQGSPSFFTPVMSNPAGTIFVVNRARLRDCASTG